MNAQCERLLEHLKRYGSITAREASRELGIDRAAARVLELREAGHSIDTKREQVLTRDGTATIARYVLKQPRFRPMTEQVAIFSDAR